MKKIIAAGAISVLLSTSALAGDLTAKLSGRFQFEGAGVNQSGLKGDEKNVSANKKKFGTASNAFVGVRVEGEKEGLKYGAQLSLVTATLGTSSPGYERSHIFLEADYGKFELGSNFDVATMMEVNALGYTRAGGDSAGDYAMSDIKQTVGTASSARDSVQLFQYNYCSLDGKKEGARKISYYTPKMNGFQLGVSYVPDSSNFGNLTVNDLSGSDGMKIAYEGAVANTVFTDHKAMKDVWAGGLSYEHHVDDDTSVKVAVTGEYGKSAKKGEKVVGIGAAAVTTNYNMPDLKTYNVGAAFTTGPYTLVASYADFGRQGSKEVFDTDYSKNKFYTVGGVYKQGPVGISVSYFKSNSHNNKMNTYVIGTDYALAPGLLPYAEVSFFDGKGKLPKLYGNDTKKKFKGAVFVLGTKLMF